MKGLIGCPMMLFIKKVIFRIIPVAILAAIIPVIFVNFVNPSFIRLISTCVICTICSSASIWLVGISMEERHSAIGLFKSKLHINK